MEDTVEAPTSTKPTRLPDEVANLTDDSLKQHVTLHAGCFYSNTPKALQVETVMSLVRGRHTFVRAGTGFGKTRISEMYFNLFNKNIVVLVLVPLESLGNDQVGSCHLTLTGLLMQAKII
jgi:superfamily II DNA or RNA helicase